jgi:hypothetical protein
MNQNNVFITMTWDTMDSIERMAKEKSYPLQDSALYKKINRHLRRLAGPNGENESLKFGIAYLLGQLRMEVLEA